MMNRRKLVASAAALAAIVTTANRAGGQSSGGQNGPPSPPKTAVLSGAIAVTQVYGDGQRLIAVALGYDRPIQNSSVDAAAFTVEARTVMRAYANISSDPAKEGSDGNFVIIELSPDDPAAMMQISKGRDVTRLLPRANVQLTGTLKAVEGTDVLPMIANVETAMVRNLIVDDFRQDIYQDAETGLTIAYNLFIPKNYDPAQSYPLVLFMHDAGVTGPVADSTLIQGQGAVGFASPETQAKHPAFVLAPQFDVQVANDASETTAHLHATINLARALIAQYKIDARRIYATGQSGGGMMSIAMNIKYPDFFAASLLVACQWDASLCRPLAKKKLWVVVAQGDEKAYPGQNAIMEVIEAEGTSVARAVWDGRSAPEAFADAVAALEAKGAQANYVAFAENTVTIPGQESGASDHRGTWRIAYGISGLRDWLLRQSL